MAPSHYLNQCQCGKQNFWGTHPKTDVPYMFYTKFHLPGPIFYSPSFKCTRIGERKFLSLNVDYSLVRYCGIHLRVISQRVSKLLFCVMGLKIQKYWHISQGTNDLIHVSSWPFPVAFRALRDLLHLEDPSMNVKHAILLDLYYYTVQFARQQEFSKEQTSAFFSIIKNTHTVCTGKQAHTLSS